jgi:hypothetical protein
MHTSSRSALSFGCVFLLLGALASLQGCASPYDRLATDPQFGQTVRAALRAQELPVTSVAKPVGVPYSELELGLESQQKAKPVTTTARPSGQSPSGLFGQ